MIKFSDYFELMKPRITILVMVTSYLGFYLGLRSMGQYFFTPEQILLFMHLMIGTFLTSSGAAVLNQVIEKDHDAKMKRTQNRPIPSGRVDWRYALNFGVVMCIVGTVYLFQFTNTLTGGLSFLTIVLYLFVYTPSKRVSTWNTVIGSIPGALPPLGGWATSTGNLSAPGWILFGILFFWQIPHFMAIAILYAKDYKDGGFKMLPGEYPNSRRTNYHILFFTIALIGTSIGLYTLKAAGIIYAVGAAVLGLGLLAVGVNVVYKQNNTNAKILLFASIIYLPLLLLLILFDR
jgi:protoheme IX farnesyltransferase